MDLPQPLQKDSRNRAFASDRCPFNERSQRNKTLKIYDACIEYIHDIKKR